MKKGIRGNFSEEPKTMNMYELILSILDQKGPVSIPLICQQVNQDPVFMKERDKPVQQAQVKSVISRKNDLFSVHNNVVSLLPEKHFISLTAEVGECQSPLLKVKVDFIKKTFIFFEINLDPSKHLEYKPFEPGSTDEFKQELYRLKIWDWDSNYEQDGIVLDGTCWSICLETRAKVFRSEGLQSFPKEWAKLCRALTKLTGRKFA